MATTLLQSELPGLTLRHRGKVRDVFDLGNDTLLMVATDRLSAFDVVLPDPIPGKGEMLCQISNFWFDKTRHIIANHLTGIDVASVLPAGVDPALYAKRAVVTRKLTPVPVECIARGYIIGSGWKDYQRTGEVSGIRLPAGLQQAQQLPAPIFTPSTKAAVGDHDENIDFATAVDLVGRERAEQVRDATLALYAFARDYAAQRGWRGSVDRNPGQLVQRLGVLGAGFFDDLGRQARAGRGLVPVQCFQVVAHELLVVAGRAGANLVLLRRPVAAGIRGEHLVHHVQPAAFIGAEFELGVGEDDPALCRVVAGKRI